MPDDFSPFSIGSQRGMMFDALYVSNQADAVSKVIQRLLEAGIIGPEDTQTFAKYPSIPIKMYRIYQAGREDERVERLGIPIDYRGSRFENLDL